MGLKTLFNPYATTNSPFISNQIVLEKNGGVTDWQSITLYRGVYKLELVGAGGGAGGWAYNKYAWGGGCGGSGSAFVGEIYLSEKKELKYISANGGSSNGDYCGTGQPGGFAGLALGEKSIIAGGGRDVAAWSTNGLGGTITNNNFDLITKIISYLQGLDGSGAGGLWASGTGGISVYNGYGSGGGHTFSGGNSFIRITYLRLRK